MSAPKPVKDIQLGNKAQQTRRKILDSARDELCERNGQLEIASVAIRGEVSPGLIYRYFNNRVDLIAAVVDAFYDRYDQWVMEFNPLPGASWLERETARTQRSLHFLQKDPLAPIVLLNQQKEPQIAAVENRRLNAHFELAVENVQLAQQRGEISLDLDANIACAMTMGGIRQVSIQMLNPDYPLSTKQCLEQIMFYISGAMKINDQAQTQCHTGQSEH